MRAERTRKRTASQSDAIRDIVSDMARRNSVILSLLIGILVGFISVHTPLISSWIALIPWGLIGLAIGYLDNKRILAIQDAAVYGSVLSFVFILAGFGGTPDKIPAVVTMALVCALIGALCGAVLGWIGFLARSLASKK